MHDLDQDCGKWSTWEIWNTVQWFINYGMLNQLFRACTNSKEVEYLYEEAIEQGWITERMTKQRINFQEIFDDLQEE